MSFIKERTVQEQANVLAGYLPNDDLHISKNIEGSNLRNVLIGLADQWLNFRSSVNNTYAEYDPRETTDLIEEWEGFVGIPDGCIDNTGTLEERRTNILLKLSGINATTAQQFETIASTLGFDVTVTAGVTAERFPLTFPFTLIGASEERFTIVVNLDASLQPSGFPLTFPFELTSGAPAILECLFNKIKPANTIVLFRYS